MSSANGRANLIFVFSQPRCGSTLLQRMLGRHPEVHAMGEPWLMLPPLYVMRPEKCEAEYTTGGAWLGLDSFLSRLPGGEEEYYEGVRRMFGYLYSRALDVSGKRFFVDKTPRYFLIIPELVRTFPDAHFVFLFRNPLSVLSSMRDIWIADNWLSLREQRLDLLDAPRLLTDARSALGGAAHTVRYERLVTDPEAEVEALCDRLGIPFERAMVDYGLGGLERWVHGDPNVHRHTRPSTDSIDKWVSSLDNPQFWRLANEYLEYLGPSQVAEMGYRWDELHTLLRRARPRRGLLWFTFSLDTVLTEQKGVYGWTLQAFLRTKNAIARYGLARALVRLSTKAMRALWQRALGAGAIVKARTSASKAAAGT